MFWVVFLGFMLWLLRNADFGVNGGFEFRKKSFGIEFRIRFWGSGGVRR